MQRIGAGVGFAGRGGVGAAEQMIEQPLACRRRPGRAPGPDRFRPRVPRADVRTLGRSRRPQGGQGRRDPADLTAGQPGRRRGGRSIEPAESSLRSWSPVSAAAPSSPRSWWTCSAGRLRGCSTTWRRSTSWDRVIAAEPASGIWLTDVEFDGSPGGARGLRRPQVAVHDRPLAGGRRPGRRGCRVCGLLTGASRGPSVGPAWSTTSGAWAYPTRSGTSTGRARPRSRPNGCGMHPYLTERMLALSPRVLAPLGGDRRAAPRAAGRLRLPRGLVGDALSPAGRILAAADAYCAWSEPRPHRPARDGGRGGRPAAGRGPVRAPRRRRRRRRAARRRPPGAGARQRLAGGLTTREVRGVEARGARLVEPGRSPTSW